MSTTNVVIALLPAQKKALPPLPFQKLRGKLSQSPESLPPPLETLTDEERTAGATERAGGSLNNVLHARIKQLAADAGISMSKAAIRLLQLPE